MASHKKSPHPSQRGSAPVVTRRLVSCVLSSGWWLGLWLIGCGTEAVGVDACLRVERARCEAAAACDLSEQAACLRYVEIQCLHGFVKSAQPTEKQANQCSSALGQLAECVEERGPKTSPARCELELTVPAPARACELVESPHEMRACRFLTPPDKDEDEDEDDDDEEPQRDGGRTSTSDAGGGQ